MAYDPPAGSEIPPRPADAMAQRWYVVAHEPGQLAVAQHAIRAAGFPTYSPMVDERAGKRIVTLPMFPGYVFAAWPDGADWGPIKRQPGVRRVLSLQYPVPTPLPAGFVEALQEAAHERRIVLDPRPMLFAAGVELRVLGGPFLNARGLCIWAKADRVRLLLDVLGGRREVTIDPRHLALA